MKWIMLIILLFLTNVRSEEVPQWVLSGILKVETRSYYKDGVIKYVDQRRGFHGERGCFQMTKIAFNQIKMRGEQFWMIETDRNFAELCAKRYLVWLYNNSGKQDWYLTIQKYNVGPSKTSNVYLNNVLLAAK